MSNIIEFLKSQEAKEKLMSLYNLDEQAVDTNKAIPIVLKNNSIKEEVATLIS